MTTADIIQTLLVDAQGMLSLEFTFTSKGYISCVAKMKGQPKNIKVIDTDIDKVVKNLVTVLQQIGWAW